jgi:phosphatidylglycerophosphatase C
MLEPPPAPPARRDVAAFDFDGTLTIKDSFTAFLAWRTAPLRRLTGFARLAPAALAYLVHRDRGRLKAAAVREFLRGVPRAQLEAEARAFADAAGRRLLRPDALRKWEDWRRNGATLAIVTASPTLVVQPFAQALSADVLIGTELAFDGQDRVVGSFVGENCRGQQKADRLRDRFGADLRLAAAYGDTSGDREMLELADERGYRLFTEKP